MEIKKMTKYVNILVELIFRQVCSQTQFNVEQQDCQNAEDEQEDTGVFPGPLYQVGGEDDAVVFPGHQRKVSYWVVFEVGAICCGEEISLLQNNDRQSSAEHFRQRVEVEKRQMHSRPLSSGREAESTNKMKTQDF